METQRATASVSAIGGPQSKWTTCTARMSFNEVASGPMGTYLLDQVGGNVPLSRFLGFWSVMGNALFAYIGTELVSLNRACAYDCRSKSCRLVLPSVKPKIVSSRPDNSSRMNFN